VQLAPPGDSDAVVEQLPFVQVSPLLHCVSPVQATQTLPTHAPETQASFELQLSPLGSRGWHFPPAQ
jgi:hypothetical protein